MPFDTDENQISKTEEGFQHFDGKNANFENRREQQIEIGDFLNEVYKDKTMLSFDDYKKFN